MAETLLSVWQKALAEVGTRSTIKQADVAAVQGGATQPAEAFYCFSFYAEIITTALRAAHWNFAKTSQRLSLWKALPGTPENQSQPSQSGWSTNYPAPPWTYSYVYPIDCMQVRSIIGQPQQVPIVPPIFSGVNQTGLPTSRLPAGRFEIASDKTDAAGNLINGSYTCTVATLLAAGSGYKVGDLLQLPTALTVSGYAAPITIPATIQVYAVNGSGGITGSTLLLSAIVPFVSIAAGTGYFLAPGPTNPVTVTGGSGSGATFNLTLVPYGGLQKVILTNLEFPIIEYTLAVGAESYWDPDFSSVVIAALAGKLAIPLTGDKALARDKIQLANSLIIEARVRDANEGLTIDDHVPDWLRVRGVGGGLGYEMYFYPFGPLFPVSPLV